MNVSAAEIKRQLARLRSTGFEALLTAAAKRVDLPASYLYAIASRETNCRNILGDRRDGEYHGVGLMQIDIQHSIARRMRDDGTWKTHSGPLIDFGADLLRTNRNGAASAFPTHTERQHLKIAASAYNQGLAGALADARHGDSDRTTTGHDYGADVVARMLVFAELTGEHV